MIPDLNADLSEHIRMPNLHQFLGIIFDNYFLWAASGKVKLLKPLGKIDLLSVIKAVFWFHVSM